MEKEKDEEVDLGAWLAGYTQALLGGDRLPGDGIEDKESWLLGYDVALQSLSEDKPRGEP